MKKVEKVVAPVAAAELNIGGMPLAKHPCGLTYESIAEHHGYNVGQAILRLLDIEPGERYLDSLKEVQWFLNREVARLEKSP
jgi:hypothetical protein